jgi:hypothetical protein
MNHFLPCATLAFCLLGSLAGAAEPPRMLFLEDAGHDATAPSGTRSGYAILRREDGGFSFYNPYAPSAEPLSLPDAQGVKHTLRPALPESIAKSKPLIESGILNNAQNLLAADGTVRSGIDKGMPRPFPSRCARGAATMARRWSISASRAVACLCRMEAIVLLERPCRPPVATRQ